MRSVDSSSNRKFENNKRRTRNTFHYSGIQGTRKDPRCSDEGIQNGLTRVHG